MRAAMGIVCRARLTQVNINHRYGVRDFTHPLFKEGEGEGAQRLAWDRLGAGWLQKKKASEEEKAQDLSEYVLTPCDKKIVASARCRRLSIGEIQRTLASGTATGLGRNLASGTPARVM